MDNLFSNGDEIIALLPNTLKVERTKPSSVYSIGEKSRLSHRWWLLGRVV